MESTKLNNIGRRKAELDVEADELVVGKEDFRTAAAPATSPYEQDVIEIESHTERSAGRK